MVKKSYYTKIMIEGFQSFGGKAVFNLDRIGLNIVAGPNGMGKSTLFNAIYWCEYGGNLKETVATWEDKRPEGYKGTRVVIERTDGIFTYRICRHLNYKGTTFGLKGDSKLMIYKKLVEEPKFLPEHLVGEGLQKVDMQLLIDEQIGVDATTFMNSIFFGQRAKSIIEAKPEDKRKLFEELFALDFVEKAKDKAKVKLSEYESAHDKVLNDLEGAEDRKEKAEETLEENKETLKNYAATKKSRMKEVEDDIAFENLRLAEIPKEIKALEDDNKKYDLKKIDALTEEVEKYRAEVNRITNDVRSEENALNDTEKEIDKSKQNEAKYIKSLEEVRDTCQFCESKLKAADVKKVKENLRKEMQIEIQVRDTLSTKVTSIKKKIEKLKTEQSEADILYKEKSAEKALLDKDSSKLLANESEIKSLNKEKDQVEARVAKLAERLDTIKNEEKPKVETKKYETIIEESINIIATSEAETVRLSNLISKTDWWIKKGFGASGLKSFVFNAMLNQLNIYAQKYAESSGWRVEFSVDMTKASKPFQTLIYDGDMVRNYKDLSGGQKQRVDVCVAFAMHDLVAHKTDINILVMDEIFEGLDNAGIELAFSLIRHKSENKAVYLITHSDIIDSLGARTINIDSDANGNTVIDE